MGVLGPFFTAFSPPHPRIPTPVSPSRWYLTYHGGPVTGGPARPRSRRQKELTMRIGLNETAVESFEQVRARRSAGHLERAAWSLHRECWSWQAPLTSHR